MFSFIKYLQGLKEGLQKNKGLWFTTITVLSILGILITMYIITTMTSNVSEKVYQNMSKGYKLELRSLVDEKEQEFKTIVAVTLANPSLLELINKNSKEELLNFTNTLNDSLLKQAIVNYKISFYSVANSQSILRPSVISVIKAKNSIYGVEVMSDGVFNTYLQPLIKDDEVYGVIEIKESIHNYKKKFDTLNDEYVFLLDKKMLSQISIDIKNGKYRDMTTQYTVARSFYDTKFAATIPEITEKNFSEMIENNYIIDGVYYRTYKEVTDINGVPIGLMIIGEYLDNEDSFVHIADDMTKTVTTVALGLVISIMLFMF